MPETVIIKGEGITLDLLLWRRDGRRGQALVEETLALNPGLAGPGPELPLGTAVRLPDPRPANRVRRRQPVSLFD